MQKYDIIGDIHGYYKNLISLLLKLGYIKDGEVYKHPKGRKVLFLGDYIDRGKYQKAVLDLVRKMVDSDNAIALMGNHEFNAICYGTKINGDYIRPHIDKNKKQHDAFLKEYPCGSGEHTEMIEWFKTLPIYFENETIRCIHATWDTKTLNKIKKSLNKNNTLTDQMLIDFHNKTDVYDDLELLLKGVEYNLPNDFYWTDKDGIDRNTMRYNWFKKRSPDEIVKYNNSALSMPDYVSLPDEEIQDVIETYNENKLVFFGHYWLQGEPEKQTNKIACLDYSVAKKGLLVAYRWNGEKEINENNFVF